MDQNRKMMEMWETKRRKYSKRIQREQWFCWMRRENRGELIRVMKRNYFYMFIYMFSTSVYKYMSPTLHYMSLTLKYCSS